MPLKSCTGGKRQQRSSAPTTAWLPEPDCVVSFFRCCPLLCFNWKKANCVFSDSRIALRRWRPIQVARAPSRLRELGGRTRWHSWMININELPRQWECVWTLQGCRLLSHCSNPFRCVRIHRAPKVTEAKLSCWLNANSQHVLPYLAFYYYFEKYIPLILINGTFDVISELFAYTGWTGDKQV